jgi:hypothetical protein
MRIWIDTEFNEFRGDLISMALVAESGHEFYASLGCKEPGEWVAEHVMPVIGIESCSNAVFQKTLGVFLKHFSSVHLIADWPEDIAHFCNALITGPGKRLSTPRLTIEIRRDLDATSEIPHNALADARAIRAKHLALEQA